MTWTIYRENTDTGKTFVVEECDKRKLGVVVYNTLYDCLSWSRPTASMTASNNVARLVHGEKVEHAPYVFSAVRDD